MTIVAAAAGLRSNLELTVPLVVIVAVIWFVWDDVQRAIDRRVRQDEVAAEWDDGISLDECFPEVGSSLRLVYDQCAEAHTDDVRVRDARRVLSPSKEMESSS